MEKKYGIISPVPTTDNLIYECCQVLTEADQRKLVKKFKAQASVEEANHTLRELILGAYVARQGFDAQYEPEIDGKTPEWLMTQKETGRKLLLELTNFHAKDTLERQMRAATSKGENFIYWMEPNDDRLYGRLQEKMGKYRDEVTKHAFHYVVAIFGLFSSALTSDEIQVCIGGQVGLFQQYPWVTGLLHFTAVGSEYCFEYHANPTAHRSEIIVKDGSLLVKRVE